MVEVVSGQSECLLLACLNVGLKFFTFIVVTLVVTLAFPSLVSVQFCLVLALISWCFICGSIHWWKVPRLSVDRIEAFLQSDGGGDIAHRGAAHDGPENTLAAFEEAKRNGAFAVEVDVGITKDHVAVLLHDWSVDRTTDGRGMLSQYTYQQVRQLNAAAKFPNRSHLPPETIPTLDECVEKCHELRLKIFFDVKDSSNEIVSVLVQLYQRYPHLLQSSMVCSFLPTLIFKLRRRNPEILTALTMTSRFFQHEIDQLQVDLGWWAYSLAYIVDKLMIWSMYNWLWYLCGNSAVLLHKDSVNRLVLDYWKDRNIRVVPWTVNNVEEKKYFRDFYKLAIITDTLTNEVDH